MKTYIVVDRGKYRSQIGWIRGSWDDNAASMKNRGLVKTEFKVYVHGVLEYPFAMRFAQVREATALEIGLWEQEQERAIA